MSKNRFGLASGSSEEKAKISILAYLTEATNAEPVGLAAARSSQLLSGTFMTRLKLYRVTKVGNTRWDPRADKALLLSTASPLSLLPANVDLRFSSSSSQKWDLEENCHSERRQRIFFLIVITSKLHLTRFN